jgi:hypothetical protein
MYFADFFLKKTTKGVHVGAYLFPCPHCGSSGQSQVASMLKALKDGGAIVDRIWLYVFVLLFVLRSHAALFKPIQILQLFILFDLFKIIQNTTTTYNFSILSVSLVEMWRFTKNFHNAHRPPQPQHEHRDIEGTQYWHSSKSENVRFFNELVAGVHDRGLKLGIYCSESQWSALMGNYRFGYADSTPLWYAHYGRFMREQGCCLCFVLLFTIMFIFIQFRLVYRRYSQL